MLDSRDESYKIIRSSLNSKYDRLVFSSESLFSKLSTEIGKYNLEIILKHFKFSKARVLVLIRDPLEYAVSFWLQSVKSLGNVDNMETYLHKFRIKQGYIKQTVETLQFLSQLEQVELIALNYSLCKNDILGAVAKWLEIDKEKLFVPKAISINRSLDWGEARLQLELNRILGKNANIIGKVLTERIPDLKPCKPPIPIVLQELIWKEAEPWVKAINSYLPDEHQMNFEKKEIEKGHQEINFTIEQMRIICETIGGEINKLRNFDSPYNRVKRLFQFLLKITQTNSYVRAFDS